ncbi:hypothetical protein [Natrinema salinisoli]|uniref:hypothetical protein n=1 Tax=Natrinema salinisoli TaxID=2878535 RepID=UPI001CF00662|nr:hypothetical protein [Natrinema salinisoli]
MRFATPVQYRWEGWGESTAAIVAMGLALAVAGIVRTLETPVSQPALAFELFVSLLVPTGLATGGVWLARRDVPSDARDRVATRVSIGIVAACALALWLVGYVTLEGGAVRDPIALVTILTAVGGATGFATAVGTSLEATSVDSADAREHPPDEDTESSSATTPEAAPPADRPTETPAGVTELIGPAVADTPTSARAAATGGETATTSASTTAPASHPRPSPNAEAGPRSGDSARSPSTTTTVSTATREPGVDTVASVPATANEVLAVLRNERARIALAVLYHEWDDETRSVDDLARAVSYHVDDSADAVEAGLRHATLPRLRAIRAVDWDPHANRVSASDHAVFEEGVREASVLLESFEPGTR